MLRPALAALLVTLVPAVATAASFTLGQNAFLSVPLACAIEQQKLMVITNTTGGNLSGGTLSFDYVRMGDNMHINGSFKNVTIAAGAQVKKGIDRAVSCTASYRKAPLLRLAPTN